jgi:intergrase/recombinase
VGSERINLAQNKPPIETNNVVVDRYLRKFAFDKMVELGVPRVILSLIANGTLKILLMDLSMWILMQGQTKHLARCTKRIEKVLQLRMTLIYAKNCKKL